MKKYALIPFVAAVSLILISWGGVGQKTVATIAYNYLAPQAKKVVKRFLGDTSMSEFVSWADQVDLDNPLHTDSITFSVGISERSGASSTSRTFF